MTRTLNPLAPEFVPGSSPMKGAAPELADSEEFISQEELDELEAVEEWVATMAGIEEAENAFLIELALELAPPQRVAEVESHQ